MGREGEAAAEIQPTGLDTGRSRAGTMTERTAWDEAEDADSAGRAPETPFTQTKGARLRAGGFRRAVGGESWLIFVGFQSPRTQRAARNTRVAAPHDGPFEIDPAHISSKCHTRMTWPSKATKVWKTQRVYVSQ